MAIAQRFQLIIMSNVETRNTTLLFVLVFRLRMPSESVCSTACRPRHAWLNAMILSSAHGLGV